MGNERPANGRRAGERRIPRAPGDPAGRGWQDPHAAKIVRALGARRCGSGWIARCPAHEDRKPSLSIGLGADGRALLKCWAGCSFEAIRDVLRHRGLWSEPPAPGQSFAGGRSGVPRAATGPTRTRPPARPTSPPPLDPEADPDRERRIALAREIWRRSVPFHWVKPAVRYVERRGLDPKLIDPDRLRAKSRCPFGRETEPALIAPVHAPGAGTICGVWRIHLTEDGRKVERRGLVRMRGCASRLFACGGRYAGDSSAGEGPPLWPPETEILGIAEGVEDALAVRQIFGIPAWAALSAGNMARLELPARVRKVLIVADADAPGRKAAVTLARRLRGEGRQVRVVEPCTAKDAADVLARMEGGT